jgi:hypothetical protein
MEERALSLDVFSRMQFHFNGLIYEVPGDSFLLEELQRMPDYSAQFRFAIISNYVASGLPALFEADVLKTYKIIAQILGYSWDSLALTLVRVAYYEGYFKSSLSLRGSYDAARDLENILPNFLQHGPLVEWSKSVPQTPVRKEPNHIPEYLHASIQRGNFLRHAMFAARSNPLIEELLKKQSSMGTEILRDRFLKKVAGDKTYSFCKCCNRPFIMQRLRGNVQGFCSEECRCKADSKKPSKQNRCKTPQGWIKFHSARNCTKCGEKRVLNVALICKKCFT